MALAPIAPWIIPPDYTRTMEAGAQLGATLRGQDIQASEASERLQHAYDQMAMEQRLKEHEFTAKMQLAQAGQALRAQQQQNLMDYRAQALQHREQQSQDLARYREGLLGNQEQRMADLWKYRQDKLAQETAAAELRKRNIHFGPNGEVLKVGDDGETVKVLRQPDVKPAKTAKYRFPMDPSKPFGAYVEGTADDPEIARRIKEGQQPSSAGPTPTGFSLLSPSTWFGRGAAPPTPPPPQAPPTPPVPPGAAAVSPPHEEGAAEPLYPATNAPAIPASGAPMTATNVQAAPVTPPPAPVTNAPLTAAAALTNVPTTLGPTGELRVAKKGISRRPLTPDTATNAAASLQAATSAVAASNAAAQAASPFKEGQYVRNKKTGKWFQVR